MDYSLGYIDMGQILIWLFWAFFFGLILWIRREDKRLGYPLDSDRQNVKVQGFPAIPPTRKPKAKHPALAIEGGTGAAANEENNYV
jgi:hypothetical protein